MTKEQRRKFTILLFLQLYVPGLVGFVDSRENRVAAGWYFGIGLPVVAFVWLCAQYLVMAGY